MSLEVPAALLEKADAGQIEESGFVDCARRSLPYAWKVISEAVQVGEHATPPPSEKERGELSRHPG